MILNEMIPTCEARYLNSHLGVSMAVVYNDNVFRIMSSRARSVSNTTIYNGYDTSLFVEVCTFFEYTTRNYNVHSCIVLIWMEGFPIVTYVAAYDIDDGEKILILNNEGISYTCQKG